MFRLRFLCFVSNKYNIFIIPEVLFCVEKIVESRLVMKVLDEVINIETAVADALKMSEIMRSWPFAIKVTFLEIATVIIYPPVVFRKSMF